LHQVCSRAEAESVASRSRMHDEDVLRFPSNAGARTSLPKLTARCGALINTGFAGNCGRVSSLEMRTLGPKYSHNCSFERLRPRRSFHARRGLAVFGVPPLRSRNSVRGTAVVFEHGLLPGSDRCRGGGARCKRRPTDGLSAVGKHIAPYLPEAMLQIAGSLASFAVIAVLFAMMFKWLPDTPVAWRDVWLGAILTAALFEVGKLLIGLYIGKQSLESTFGAAASVVVVLIWVYYTAQLVLMGAEFPNAAVVISELEIIRMRMGRVLRLLLGDVVDFRMIV
jgi:Virulence factor BrkB